VIGAVRFFVRNPVAASVVMWAMIVGGLYSAFTMRREFFPDLEPDAARIILAYPGASPQEVEDTLARKIEDAVLDIQDVDRITTTILEGGGGIVVKFDDGADVRRRIDDLRNRIESLQDLPADAERIRVVEFEPNLPVIQVTVFGETDEETLKRSILEVEDDLRAWPGMGTIAIAGTRRAELRVEVDRDALLRHRLAITSVADSISAWMREVPGGSLRTRDSETSVRTLGVGERADLVRQIVVKADGEGRIIRVGDIALVEEGWTEDEVGRRFNGLPASNLTVFRTGKQDAVRMAEFVRGYVKGRRGEPVEVGFFERIMGSPRLDGWVAGDRRGPGSADIQAHNDLARLIEGRLELLTGNAVQGALLVFIALLLGINWRVAWWVTAGIALAIMGTLLVMNATGVSLNLLTMFALLIALGMLADDAVVFAESIDQVSREGVPTEEACTRGVSRVFWPVVGSVSTTMVAFLPLSLVGGRIGDLLGELPAVVTLALAVSVIEAVLVLPSHLYHSMRRLKSGKRWFVDRYTSPLDRWREGTLWPRITARYTRIATWCVDHRYTTVTAAIALFIVSLGMVAGGRVAFTFLPADDTETFIIDVRMPLGTPVERTREIGARFEAAARSQPESRAITSIYGVRLNYETAVADSSSGNLAQIFVELAPVEERDRRSGEVIDAVRRAAGEMPEVEDVQFTEISGGPAGSDITYELSGTDIVALRAATEDVKEMLAGYASVLHVSDDDFDAQPEIAVELNPSAAALGFTPAGIARQVRGALFGIDAHTYSADREDVDVRVRLDDASRGRSDLIDLLWVVPPAGPATPLSEIADITLGTSSSVIRRIDRARTISVTADVEDGVSPEVIVRDAAPKVKEILARHAGVISSAGGRQKDLNEAFAALPLAILVAFGLIYVILAWLFGNYLQPFAIMMSIPFGIVGAIWGHFMLGYDLTFLSVIGLVALAGVVVNNAIVLVEFVNVERRAGFALRDALVIAGRRRVRPILLTSITTILGLAPIVLEQSFQARFLAPMAISLCAGLASATALTLLLLPSMLYIIDDGVRLLRRIFHGPTARTLPPQ